MVIIVGLTTNFLVDLHVIAVPQQPNFWAPQTAYSSPPNGDF